MAEAKTSTKNTLEREYVVPLRREWMKAARYKKTAKGVRALKEFIARHMRVADRDTSKVKLDVYLNNELWFRGGKKPPSKVKVKARRDGEFVRVEFVDTPKVVKFAKARSEKRHKKVEKKKTVAPAGEKKEGLEEKIAADSEQGKTEEEKKEEKEKSKSAEQANLKLAEQTAKAQKHTSKVAGSESIVQRKALKK